jgi:hypothetical protein
MKPLKQKQQEALERRKKNLQDYKSDKNAIEFVKDGITLTTDEEKAGLLARKIAVCEADIAVLEQKLEAYY